jgi:hypothetical protein
MDIELPKKPKSVSPSAWQRIKQAWPWLVSVLGVAGAIVAINQLNETNTLNADNGLDILAQTTRSVAPGVADLAGAATDLLSNAVTRPVREEVLRTQAVAQSEFDRLGAQNEYLFAYSQNLEAQFAANTAELAARTEWLAAQLAPANQIDPTLAAQAAVEIPQVVYDQPIPVPELIPMAQQYWLDPSNIEQFDAPPPPEPMAIAYRPEKRKRDVDMEKNKKRK